MNVDLSISIVTYNTDPAELTEAIRSCFGSGIRVELVVVDNSPNDEIGTVCKTLGVKYIHTGSNLGFGRAHNIGIKNSPSSKYHLILNPDVQFDGSVLAELIEFMEMNEGIGLVMPRVLYPDGSSQNLCKRLPSPLDILAKRFLSRVPLKSVDTRLAAFELRDIQTESVLSVPYLSGCFMLLRRRAIEAVTGFDERFFMYFEDLDLSRRIRQHYETAYYPWKSVTHRHEMGSYKSARLLICGLKSAVKYFNKWGWIWDAERSAMNSKSGPLLDLNVPAERCVEVGER